MAETYHIVIGSIDPNTGERTTHELRLTVGSCEGKGIKTSCAASKAYDSSKISTIHCGGSKGWQRNSTRRAMTGSRERSRLCIVKLGLISPRPNTTIT